MNKIQGVDTVVRPLSWDSVHFGFAIGCLDRADLEDEELSLALEAARSHGYRLIYWAANPGRLVPEFLLARFSGRLVDNKAKFESNLTHTTVPAPKQETVGVVIVEYPKGEPTAELLDIGIAAGSYSRFNRDPGISSQRFRELYTTWTTRSTRREIADIVFVAEAHGRNVGLVTISADASQGEIGLLAISENFRGLGIGSLLLKATHEWLKKEGIFRSSVTTQLDNTGACRLYEKCGYRLQEARPYFHFWL